MSTSKMKHFVFVIIAVISFSTFGDSRSRESEYPREVNRFHTVDTDTEETDVYWRTWTGRVPTDAIVGGYTDSDCGTDIPIYMGKALQTTPSAAIVPVQIFKRSKSVKMPYAGKVSSTKKAIQVMCARDSSIVTWISKNDTDRYNVSADKDCVIGGTELQKFNTFFGRTKYDGATVIGKVLHHNSIMYFADDGEEHSVKDYEILCFTKAVEYRKIETLKRKEEKRLSEEAEMDQVKMTEDEANVARMNSDATSTTTAKPTPTPFRIRFR